MLRRGHGIVRIVRDCDHPVSRIVLDQIFQRRRELRIILDNQDLEHRIPPHPLEKSTKFDAHPKWSRCESPLNIVYDEASQCPAKTNEKAGSRVAIRPYPS